MSNTDRSWQHSAGVLVCLAAALLVVPTAAAAPPPALDEYLLDYPDAGGEKEGGRSPVARPDKLPASTRRALGRDAEGRTLVTLGTAQELGAPRARAAPRLGAAASPAGDAGGSDRSVLSATAAALGSPAGLTLLGAIAALTALGLAIRRTRETAR